MDLLGVWLKIHVSLSLVAVATEEATKENCWQSLKQRSACCNDEWTCWDAIFTKDGWWTVVFGRGNWEDGIP